MAAQHTTAMNCGGLEASSASWRCMAFLLILSLVFVKNTHGQSPAPTVAEVDSAYKEGRELYYDGDYESAIAKLLIARDMYKRTDSVPAELSSAIYLRLGESYRRSRIHEPALAYLDTSRMIAIDTFGPVHEYVADVYLEESIVYSQMMYIQKADELNEKALDIYKEVFGPRSDIVGIMYMNMALDAYKVDEFERAESLYLQAKSIFEEVLQPDDENFNRIYNNMGMLYRVKKDYEKALDFALIALDYKLRNYAPDHPTVGKYHANIALTYMAMGEYEQALPYLDKSIEILRNSLGEMHPEYAAALSDKAELLQIMGEPQLALKTFEHCYAIITAQLGENHPYSVACLSSIATCHEDLGDIDRAISIIERSNSLLERSEEVYFPDLYSNGIYLASLYKRKGMHKRARAICDSLLNELLQRSKVNNTFGFATEYSLMQLMAHSELAEIYKTEAELSKVGALDSAWVEYTAAIDIIERIRREVVSEESQYYIYEESEPLYTGAIEVAAQLFKETGDADYFYSALQLSEDSKSIVLRRALLDRSATVFGGIPEGIVSTLTSLENQLYDLQHKLRPGGILTDKDSIVLMTKQAVALEERRDSLIDAIELTYPEYYSMKYAGSALQTKRLQEVLNEENKALISYYLPDSTGFAFYMSADQRQIAEIDLTGEEVEWIKTLATSETPIGAGFFDHSMCETLSDKLIGPFEELLRNESLTRLVVSPHGVLSYLPLDLLRVRNKAGGRSWMSESYAISYVHSLSILGMIAPVTNYTVNYAGFAPVYDRVPENDAVYAMRNTPAPLPATAQEISYGAELFHGRAFVREDATYRAFLDHSRDARILHLATHATVKPEAPFDSYLHFYQVPDESQHTRERKLTMFEIYKARIPASLVILSACESGGGDLRAGEGPMSLARAFRYAGSGSVAMNLWPANDAVSKDIVRIFLKNLADGLPKDVALQQAKKAYLAGADPFFAHPFFWAGLTLYGDTEALERPARRGWLITGLAISLFLLGGLWVWRKR